MQWFRDFFYRIGSSFVANPALHIFDILFFMVLLYFVFSFLKKNNATKLIALFLPIMFIVVVLSSDAVGFPVLGRVLLYFVMFGSILLILLFPAEVRRLLWRISAPKEARDSFKNKFTVSDDELKETIEQIVKSTQNLAKNNIGALIVIMPSTVPEHIIESGTGLDAKVSSNLIESIFQGKSPLHDGALCIVGDRVMAAGCFLPLSQERSLDKDLGTRHRAAIGVTEVYKAYSIVVSEESGVISSATRGELNRYLDSAMLTEELMQVYGIKALEPRKRRGKKDGR